MRRERFITEVVLGLAMLSMVWLLGCGDIHVHPGERHTHHHYAPGATSSDVIPDPVEVIERAFAGDDRE